MRPEDVDIQDLSPLLGPSEVSRSSERLLGMVTKLDDRGTVGNSEAIGSP